MTDMTPLSPTSSEAVEEFRRKEKLGKRRAANRSVCICGHSLNFHTEVEGYATVCTPAKMNCKCSKIHAVLEADNLRMFLNNTTGVGTAHALGKGVVASLARESGFRWIESPLRCDMCLEATEEPIPVAVDIVTEMPTDVSTGRDKIVCPGCYASWVVSTF
jgi:hypothetical protein